MNYIYIACDPVRWHSILSIVALLGSVFKLAKDCVFKRVRMVTNLLEVESSMPMHAVMCFMMQVCLHSGRDFVV